MYDDDPGGRRHHGSDATGGVEVSIDDSGDDVRVRLAATWRRTVDVDMLGAAIVSALRAATTERLEAWAGGAFEVSPPTERRAPPTAPVDRQQEQLRTLSRAFRDLTEFQLRLAELNQRPTTAGDQGGLVRSTVQAGTVIALQLDQEWARRAGDGDIAGRAGQALRAALRAAAHLPAQALQGCPDLTAVLCAGGNRPPFLPEPEERNR